MYQLDQHNQATNAYNQSASQPTAVPAPRTVSSALASIDGLNEKLAELRKHMSHVAELIGGPRPMSSEAKRDTPPSSGAVGRLNDAADVAHYQISELADLLAAIHRALG